MAEISAIPQQPQLGRLAQFLRYLETEKPEFLPSQLDVMGLVRQLTLPQASTVENLSYGNLPFTMPPSGTGAMIPQVKTGRKAEVADLVGMLGGVPGGRAMMDVGTKLSNEAADAIVRTITRNPAATAPQVIQETAMPFMQAVAPRAPGLLETPVKSDLGFYSALEQATIPLQNKGTGTQFLAQIEKTAGVKPEEIKWTGLDEFLKSKPNVTKAEVQDYLAANRVDLQEVRLGDASAYGLDDMWKGAEAARTKFSQYTLPGGQNYREILLTLPEPKEAKMFRDLELRVNAGERLKPEELQQYRDLVDAKAFQGQFHGSHFDQPNILAHMRVNDRVVDGKKTLFIEEIQSDWHQAGRKKGYAQQLNPEQLTASEVLPKQPGPRTWTVTYPNGNTATFAGNSADDAISAAVARESKIGVPDAPFKTTWHELSLKRAIQEASEKGYDQIAFTTGKTQAERYDLSKQLDKVKVRRFRDEWVVEGYKGNTEVLGRSAKNDEELSALIGKDLAEKAIKDNGGSYSGLDLQVGGEGMKGFYDNILPKSLDKLGKKFDAKVTKSKLPGSQSKDDLTAKVYGRGETYKNLPSELKRKIDQMYMDDGVEVWAMDITPKMRESVLTKGQPLFAATPALPALGLLGDEGE